MVQRLYPRHQDGQQKACVTQHTIKVVRFLQVIVLLRRTVTDNNKVDVESRYRYLQRRQKRYRHARQDRKALLDDTGAHAEMHRKPAIGRLIGSLTLPKASVWI